MNGRLVNDIFARIGNEKAASSLLDDSSEN
jgi:hypothetical protein